MVSKFRILTILMWKHWTVRKRRFIATPIELVSPALIFILLFSVRNFLTAKPSVEHSDNIFNTESFDLPYNKAPKLVLYTPNSQLSNTLMDEVGKQLNIRRIDTLSGSISGYYALKNESLDAVEHFIKTHPRAAFVIFPDMAAGDTLPNKLNYTIRMNTDFMPHIYHSLDDEIGPHERFGTIYEPFMCLQWAIDSSYLKVLTGNEINMRVRFQEFPYVDARQNKVVANVCDMLKQLSFLSLAMPFFFLMPRLIGERSSGVQELIKLVGVSNLMLGFSHFLNTLPNGLVYAISGSVLLTVSDTPLIPMSNGFLIFVALLLHFIAIMSIAFAASYIIKSSQYATTLASVVYIGAWLPAGVAAAAVAGAPGVAAALLPHVPLIYFWNEVAKLEEYGQGLSLSNMWKAHTTMSAASCFLFLALQASIFFLLAWYLSMVRPGQYGVALPWNFLCKLSFWTKKKVTPDVLNEEEEEPITKDPLYFENPPSHAEVGIKISNVTKVFSKQRALSDVTFDVFKGEITVLLGHNGAGKTTLMSIITGMYSPTEGSVQISGVDITDRSSRGANLVGLCPQHNVCFPDLTVLEHAVFFALFRGKSFAEAHNSSVALLEKLGIEDKANSKSSELSGGMKRRLQLACALSGGADVLILDEPTSGLDVETRRELWDLLLSLRGSRTVLLTTHFMEEADALGDRVAALHAGRLRCHATPMFLKKNIGTGYRLSLTTIGLPKETAINNVVKNIVPDATIKEKTYNSISFTLPAQYSKNFPQLFMELESRRSELGVDSIGVGVSTLEEVFLKLCSDYGMSVPEDEVDGRLREEPTFTYVSGLRLYLRQFYVLAKRQLLYMWFHKQNFLLLQIILPVILIFYFSSGDMKEVLETGKESQVSMSLDLYKRMPDRRVFVSGTDPQVIDAVQERYKDVKFRTVPDIAQAIMRTGEKDSMQYSKYLVGVELNDTDAKVLYTTTVRHAAPVALNLLSNMLAARYLPWADGATLAAYNRPLRTLRTRTLADNKLTWPVPFSELLVWTGFIIFLLCGSLLGAMNLPVQERKAGTRHIHIMSGCSPALHWLTTLATHTTVYMLLLIVPTCIAAIVGRENTVNAADFIGSFFLVCVLGCMAFLSCAYLFSFNLGQNTAGLVFVLIIMLFGLAPGIADTYSSTMGLDLKNWKYPIAICSYVSPPHAWTAAVGKSTYVAMINALCNLNRDKCSLLSGLDAVFKGFNSNKCCVQNQNPLSYLSFEEYTIGKEITVMLIQIIVFMTLVIMTQHGFFNSCWDSLVNVNYRPTASPHTDEMVRAEKTYVNQAIKLPTKQIQDAMLVNDVHKNYFRCLKPLTPCNAVKGLSFSVKKGECFGLLGVNGAGKSTTFKMMTGEECTTSGSIFANGSHLKQPRKKYLQSLGYCPQFFGLDEFLTGRDNLACLLTLRGLDDNSTQRETDAWIQIVGLEKYRSASVSGYSGGCTRRLGTAACLSRGAAVSLLDEPTSGVDVSARRRVWAALRRAQAQRRALVVTSHSMDEMEALCDRIAIMCAGSCRALGGAAALRAAHAAGHAVLIKIRTPSATAPLPTDETDSASSYLQNLKTKLNEKFNCTLKDEHKTMLHYHINETMRYSELFSTLEQLKQTFPNLIEDYSVTETTLEEVFLSFAHQPEHHEV